MNMLLCHLWGALSSLFVSHAVDFKFSDIYGTIIYTKLQRSVLICDWYIFVLYRSGQTV